MQSVSVVKPGMLHPIPKEPIPFSTVHVDHVGPFIQSKKEKYIFISTGRRIHKIYLFASNKQYENKVRYTVFGRLHVSGW